ncbi:MAG TPA: hypothetical protein V6C97_34885 [Oculatellaceae cyanobacterium]
MLHDVSDKVPPNSLTSVTFTPERMMQLVTENQVGFVRPPAEWPLTFTPIPGFDNRPAPSLVSDGPGGGQINDCSKEKCTISGKEYKNSVDIPGNHPKPLLHHDGKPVIGPDGQPIMGPNGVDLEKISQNMLAHRNWFTVPSAVWNFRHSGQWDFQRIKNDDGRAIWTKEYANFANVGVGYILGSLGMTLKDIGGYGDFYCGAVSCDYSEKRSPEFPNLADRQVKDFEIGIELYKENHPNKTK